MTAAQTPDEAAASRRDFLKRALRAGAYVAPLVTAMSMRNLAAAQTSKPMNKGMGKG